MSGYLIVWNFHRFYICAIHTKWKITSNAISYQFIAGGNSPFYMHIKSLHEPKLQKYINEHNYINLPSPSVMEVLYIKSAK